MPEVVSQAMGYSLVVCALAGVIQGLTGFGFGIVAMAALPYFVPLRLCVPLVSLLGATSLVSLAWKHRKETPFGSAMPLCLGVLVGSPIGVHLLTLHLEAAAHLTIATVLCLVSGYQLAGVRRNSATPVFPGSAATSPVRASQTVSTSWGPQRPAATDPLIPGGEGPDSPMALVPWAAGTGIGVLMGILGGWLGMGGPPIILYAYTKLRPDTARRLLIAAFVLSSPIVLLNLTLRRVWEISHLLWYVPIGTSVVLGTLLGALLAARIPPAVLAGVVWILLFIMGLGQYAHQLSGLL